MAAAPHFAIWFFDTLLSEATHSLHSCAFIVSGLLGSHDARADRRCELAISATMECLVVACSEARRVTRW